MASHDATTALPDAVPARSSEIVRLEAIPVEVPWAARPEATDERAYRWAFGVKPSGAAVLVRLETADGVVGWGEASGLFHPTMPLALIRDTIKSLEPLVIGSRAQDMERLLARAYADAGWHFARGLANYALSGIEMACWDIVGKLAGMPLCDLFGGRVRPRVDFMWFVYRDSIEAMLAEAREAVAGGFDTIYVKVGWDAAEDVAVVRALREELGSGVRLRVDANEAWSPGVATRMIRALERYDLEFVEQPTMAQDLAGLAEVRRRVATPICADQGARTPHDVLAVARAGAADLISVCPGDAGGLLAARKAAAIAEAAGMPVFIHSNIELGIATAAHVHLAAALPNCHYASQTEYQLLAGDVLAGEGLALADGAMEVPDAPGLGIEVDTDRVEHYHEEFLRSRNGSPDGDAELSSFPGY